MFKERVRSLMKDTGIFLLVLICFLLFLWAAVSWTWLGKTIEYTGLGLFALIATMGVLAILYYLYKFLYWLFIEPYLSWRKGKSLDE